MAEGQIVVELILDDGQILKALGKVKQEADKVKDEMESDKGGGFLSKKLGDISVGMAALGVAAYKAMDLLKQGFATSVAAARESQKAVDDLSTALAVNGKYTEGAVSGFQKFAGVLSEQTGVNDDIITQNASLLVSLGKLSGEGLENATKAALDLAAATGKDASAGFRMVALAAEGSTAGLAKYGIKVDENLPKSERFASALQQLNEKFGGLAALRGETFEGTLNKLANAFDDMFKAFGNVIVQSPAIRGVLSTIATIVGELTEKFKAWAAAGNLENLIKDTISFGRAFVSYVAKPIEVFFNAAVTGTSAVSTAFLGLVLIFVKIHNALIEYVISPIVKFFGETIGGFVSKFAPEIGAGITEAFSGVSTALIKGSEITAEAVGGLYESSLETTVDAANATFDTSVSNTVNSVLARVEEGANKAKAIATDLKVFSDEQNQEIIDNGLTVGQGFTEMLNGFDTSIKQFAENAKANFQKVGASMFQALGSGAANAFAAFGKALVTGQNAMQAFLNSLLASFGAALIQMGTMFILQGIAYSYAGMPNGPPLIAAGAALAAFGGILSALGGGGGAASGAGASGGGGGGASSAESPTATLAQPEAPRPQDKITVNIQGDVLDSDETGSRIVSLLSTYADKNGNGAVVT